MYFVQAWPTILAHAPLAFQLVRYLPPARWRSNSNKSNGNDPRQAHSDDLYLHYVVHSLGRLTHHGRAPASNDRKVAACCVLQSVTRDLTGRKVVLKNDCM